MLVPKGISHETLEIKKSRFISIAKYTSSAEESRDILKTVRLEYSDSSHIVHAFLSGPGSDIFGYSDDHEPSGTAGRPILEVLKGSGLGNIIILVIRYFGGIKLGTGGLVKAYTEAAQLALKHLPVEELVSRKHFSLNVPYKSYDSVFKILKKYSADVEEPVFDTKIHIIGTIPEKNCDLADTKIQDISSGRIILDIVK